MLQNRNFVRGICLMAIVLIFGLGALNYNIVQLSRSGPGLFPMMVSSFLFLIGAITVIRAYYVAPVPLNYNVKNIAIILGSLVGFVIISEYISMLLAITYLAFFSTLAGTSYSWVRNVKIAVVLICIAYAFQKFLGLNLPL